MVCTSWTFDKHFQKVAGLSHGLCMYHVSLVKTLNSTLSLSTQVYKCVVSLDRTLYSTLSLSTHVYKRVAAFESLEKPNRNAGGVGTSLRSRGE